MITQIDVRSVLARVVADGHLDLVTRPTGRAVRSSIELELAQLTGLAVVVLDFSAVRIIDCSCADEIVAKLLLASLAADAATPAIFLIRGLDDDQIDDIEEVLRRQRLALVAEARGGLRLLGDLTERTRTAFERLARRGRAAAEELAAELAWPLEDVRAALEELAGRRLVLQEAGLYRAPSAA